MGSLDFLAKCHNISHGVGLTLPGSVQQQTKKRHWFASCTVHCSLAKGPAAVLVFKYGTY